MKSACLLLVILSPFLLHAQDERPSLDPALIPITGTTPETFVPRGWEINHQIDGDLNGDRQPDVVLDLLEKPPARDPKNTWLTNGLHALVLPFHEGKATRCRVPPGPSVLLYSACIGMLNLIERADLRNPEDWFQARLQGVVLLIQENGVLDHVPAAPLLLVYPICTGVSQLIEHVPVMDNTWRMDQRRALVVLFREGNGTLRRVAVGTRVLLCPNCGGRYANSEPVTIENGILSVEHLIGSGISTDHRQDFRWDRRRRTMVMVRERAHTYNRSEWQDSEELNIDYVNGVRVIERYGARGDDQIRRSRRQTRIPAQPRPIEEVDANW